MAREISIYNYIQKFFLDHSYISLNFFCHILTISRSINYSVLLSFGITFCEARFIVLVMSVSYNVMFKKTYV